MEGAKPSFVFKAITYKKQKSSNPGIANVSSARNIEFLHMKYFDLRTQHLLGLKCFNGQRQY